MVRGLYLQTALTETCERLQEGASPAEVFRGMAEAASRSMGAGSGGPAMTPDAIARLVNHVADTPGLAEVSARMARLGRWLGDGVS